MSKELEALETLKLLKDFVLKNNKNGLDRRFIIGSCDILEKELKALEIIKEKNVDIHGIKETKNVHEYNVKFPTTLNEFLEEQKYDLLKKELELGEK